MVARQTLGELLELLLDRSFADLGSEQPTAEESEPDRRQRRRRVRRKAAHGAGGPPLK